MAADPVPAARPTPRHRKRTSLYRRLRSVADVVLAALFLVAAVPLVAAIALLIKLDSEGPVFFRHQRIGRRGRQFEVVKFRTMRLGTPAYSVKVDDYDPSVTRVGRVLRRTGLDELPQLWNVLRGEMALIGPRPEQAALWRLYAQPWQEERHEVRPGITGWWQVNHRDGSPLHLHIEKDIHYVRHQGPLLDALILLKTLQVVASGLTRWRAPRLAVVPDPPAPSRPQALPGPAEEPL